jgi:hypothetical protein
MSGGIRNFRLVNVLKEDKFFIANLMLSEIVKWRAIKKDYVST